MYKGDRDLPLPPIRLYCLNHFLRILDKTKRLSVIIPTLQQRCDSKLFCLEILSSFVPDYLMYPYYPSLPIYCYHFVINIDNSHNISQPVSKFIIAYTV